MNKENENAEEKAAGPVLATWADLEERLVVNFEIEREGGTPIVLPMKELSYAEWIEAEFEYPWPTPPAMGINPNSGLPLFNTADHGYIKASAECEANRTYSRILKSIQIEIPGETREEQMASLHKLGSRITKTLRAVLSDMHAEGKARVASHAENFQPDGNRRSRRK